MLLVQYIISMSHIYYPLTELLHQSIVLNYSAVLAKGSREFAYQALYILAFLYGSPVRVGIDWPYVVHNSCVKLASPAGINALSFLRVPTKNAELKCLLVACLKERGSLM